MTETAASNLSGSSETPPRVHQFDSDRNLYDRTQVAPDDRNLYDRTQVAPDDRNLYDRTQVAPADRNTWQPSLRVPVEFSFDLILFQLSESMFLTSMFLTLIRNAFT